MLVDTKNRKLQSIDYFLGSKRGIDRFCLCNAMFTMNSVIYRFEVLMRQTFVMGSVLIY